MINNLFRKETKSEAIERLKEEYEKLYVVDVYITDWTAGASTWLWNIYANKEDAKRWIKLSRRYNKEMYPMTCEEPTHNTFTYRTKTGHHMEERFVLSVA